MKIIRKGFARWWGGFTMALSSVPAHARLAAEEMETSAAVTLDARSSN